MTPATARELIARHFDRRAAEVEAKGDFGGKQLAQWWRFIAARVREVTDEELATESEEGDG